MKYKVTNNYADAEMTSALGEVLTNYDKLVREFGEPIHGSGDGKVTAEWIIKFADGQVATIYDWKEGKTPMYEYDWHIGGRKHIVVKRIRDIMENAR